MDDFVVISTEAESNSTSSPFDILYIRDIPNKQIVREYIFPESLLQNRNDNIICSYNIINQMFLDIPREDIYIHDCINRNKDDILRYVVNHYDSKDKFMIYFFLTQISFVLPLEIMYKITRGVNDEIVIADNCNSRVEIRMYPGKVIVTKTLQAVFPKGSVFLKFLKFKVTMDVNTSLGMTRIFIESVL